MNDTRMQRLVIWGLCTVSLCITLALIRSIKVKTGLDPFSVIVYGFIPVGAMFVAGMASAGYILGAHYFKWRADGWDGRKAIPIDLSEADLLCLVTRFPKLNKRFD